jgi:pimeloyl-ACP methyl ester carboxylesterase
MYMEQQNSIILKTMGSLFFGGSVTVSEDGNTFHGDHGYAQYYIPQNSRNLPLIMWHGIGQSGKTYESTPDGREGFQAIFTRRDWPVYIIDQPRRGRAGRTQAINDDEFVPTIMHESSAWDAFRLGIWTPPEKAFFFSKINFPQDPASIEQFFRQQTPDTGAEPFSAEHRKFMGDTMAELFRLTGPGILITHSNSGQYGWATGMAAPELIKAIVCYESGAFAFPSDKPPADIPAKADLVADLISPQLVPPEEFKKLTKMPIIIFYGDNISSEPSTIFNVDLWRVASLRARQFVEEINRQGGDATLIMLPEIGIKGNTHIAMADFNNIEIADLLEKFLREKGLDGRDLPHNGPGRKAVTSSTIPLK